MAFVKDITEEVIRLMLSGEREPMNKLGADVAANATSLTFQYDMSEIGRDSYIEVDTEIYRVWELNKENAFAVVEPGMIGSESTSHTAGTLCYINPRIPRHAALIAFNEEIAALSSPAIGMFAVNSVNITASAAITEYDLDTNADEIIDVLAVRCSTPGAQQRWIDLKDWQYRDNAYPGDFPSGKSLYVPSSIPNETIQVIYSTDFVPATGLNDDITIDCLIPDEYRDIVAMSVLLNLGSVREIKRNFTEVQGDTRRADEVPASAVGQSFSYVRARREQRIAQEAARLFKKWGPRTRT